jgi:hypothetical protein
MTAASRSPPLREAALRHRRPGVGPCFSLRRLMVVRRARVRLVRHPGAHRDDHRLAGKYSGRRRLPARRGLADPFGSSCATRRRGRRSGLTGGGASIVFPRRATPPLHNRLARPDSGSSASGDLDVTAHRRRAGSRRRATAVKATPTALTRLAVDLALLLKIPPACMPCKPEPRPSSGKRRAPDAAARREKPAAQRSVPGAARSARATAGIDVACAARSASRSTARSTAARHRRLDPARPEGAPTYGGQLPFASGLGGFTADGRQYVIRLTEGQTTPAPGSTSSQRNSVSRCRVGRRHLVGEQP